MGVLLVQITPYTWSLPWFALHPSSNSHLANIEFSLSYSECPYKGSEWSSGCQHVIEGNRFVIHVQKEILNTPLTHPDESKGPLRPHLRVT